MILLRRIFAGGISSKGQKLQIVYNNLDKKNFHYHARVMQRSNDQDEAEHGRSKNLLRFFKPCNTFKKTNLFLYMSIQRRKRKEETNIM